MCKPPPLLPAALPLNTDDATAIDVFEEAMRMPPPSRCAVLPECSVGFSMFKNKKYDFPHILYSSRKRGTHRQGGCVLGFFGISPCFFGHIA
jgi:hypothetical protein